MIGLAERLQEAARERSESVMESSPDRIYNAMVSMVGDDEDWR